MLVTGLNLTGTPIMSLQTGAKLAQTAKPVIDPENLTIVAYEVEGALLSEKPSFLRIADIREFSNIGMIVDSSDEFVRLNDVIKIKELHKLNFRLIGMPVIDKKGHKLGKVDDYIVENSSFIIKQLSVKSGILRSLNNTSRLIDRSQIVEINNDNIVIKNNEEVEPVKSPLRKDFINPFNSSSMPTTERSLANRP